MGVVSVETTGAWQLLSALSIGGNFAVYTSTAGEFTLAASIPAEDVAGMPTCAGESTDQFTSSVGQNLYVRVQSGRNARVLLL